MKLQNLSGQCLKGTVLGLAMILPLCSLGQENSPLIKELSDKVIEARKVSDELLPHYSWTSRTEVLKGKEVLNILIERNQFGPDGTVISKTLNEQGAKMPTSFLIRDIAEEEKANIEKFLYGLRDFLHKYSFADHNRLVQFMQSATIEKPDTTKEIVFNGKNVVQPYDDLKWWIDGVLYTTSRTEVTTVFQDDTIRFTATFVTLRNGLNYMGYAEMLIPAKKMTLTIQNYDYTPE